MSSRINNPDRYLFCSRDSIPDSSSTYSSIRIPLRTAILDVKSCELIRANIPAIVPSFPDTALVFWYYKLPRVSEELCEPVPPAYEYLHCVRIQPSFVPKELIPDGFDVPVNRVYDNYDDLLPDLNKACAVDVNNPFFIENDIGFSYSSESKKFAFTGNDVYNGEGLVVHFYRYAGYSDPNVLAASQALFDATKNNFAIEGLGGQPFYAGETLNKRLGFTYDGGVLSDNQYKSLCRPVPHYLLQQESPLFDVHTYVAESWCNLVHTANVNIFANFVIGSGYSSSSGNNNFLNSVALSTGALGVASFQNSIDTHLYKVNSEISEVVFDLRCDNGEPFVLPKTAIFLIEIKFSYT